MKLDPTIVETTAHAGELLIRAAAVLGTLTPAQQNALRQATDGGLPDSVKFALDAAEAVAPQIQESMRRHPPVGLIPAEQSASDKLAARDRAARFMTELLGSVETLSGIAETQGVQTLADLMYLQSAILDESFIELCNAESRVLDVVRELPSRAEWEKYIHTDLMPETGLKTWKDFGYESCSTGGGFVAYFKQQGNIQVLVTCSDRETRLPSPTDKVDIGFYQVDTGESLIDPIGDGLATSQADGLLYIDKQLAQIATESAPKQKKKRAPSLGM